jgi:hypothetical protein
LITATLSKKAASVIHRGGFFICRTVVVLCLQGKNTDVKKPLHIAVSGF